MNDKWRDFDLTPEKREFVRCTALLGWDYAFLIEGWVNHENPMTIEGAKIQLKEKHRMIVNNFGIKVPLSPLIIEAYEKLDLGA